ncbi:hypothetical protein COCCADRAFT_83278 [Bipolaris zeicola 26-R-13]|uniref:Uncharacterized protein n=1 Tax=Cochliobolus carbonum (strain 26-R-13) TaxID=930089 RepID=W6YSE6_COCC2|nr:uncharacterized protein COCCADRAFT_83278 [Bipolaris zeicola 26-R-13]EUC38324.1 hypothetical protein COCCADRAFT_83278 [Bipolaris zeicola 26-R-13]
MVRQHVESCHSTCSADVSCCRGRRSPDEKFCLLSHVPQFPRTSYVWSNDCQLSLAMAW